MISTLSIGGFGAYAPPTVVTNADLAKRVDTSDEWIVSRTGISERRVAEPGLAGSDLALEAAKAALARSGRAVEEITHIIYCGCTPDAVCPSAACSLGNKLGAPHVAGFDLNAACSSYVYGLTVARGIVLADPSACILLAAAEVLSHRCNWEDRSTCVLFGDGAGACLVCGKDVRPAAAHAVPDAELIDVRISGDASLGKLLEIGGGSSHPYTLGQPVGEEYFIRMQGREVFKHAVRSMGAICREILEANNLSVRDIDVLVPHQANSRIIEAVGDRLEVPADKVFVNVQKYGNTSAASIPLALGEALDAGVIKPGMTVLLTTFGGGFTWGAALLRFLPAGD